MIFSSPLQIIVNPKLIHNYNPTKKRKHHHLADRKMKWGRRRESSSASSSGSRPFLKSHAFLFSWLSKFKHMGINISEPNHGKMKHRAKQNSTPVSAPQYSSGNLGVDDGNAFRRSSFGEEIRDNHEDKKSDDENYVIPSSGFPTGRRKNAKKHGTREGTLKFNENKDEYNREMEPKQLRSRFETKAQRVPQAPLMKLERETSAEEVECSSRKVVEKGVLQLEVPRHSFADSSSGSDLKVRGIEDWHDERAGRQLKVKTNKKRQTVVDVSREPTSQRIRKPKHSPRLRIYSPRMASKVEVCRTKAIQDMRKAKLKMKKLQREQVVEEIQGPDGFAVIKCSLDPKQDFRDSMVEMIMEKQISHTEEMEELLACYLTLNADEYHDLIIDVFRQVWFDMNLNGLGIKSNICNVLAVNNYTCES